MLNRFDRLGSKVRLRSALFATAIALALPLPMAGASDSIAGANEVLLDRAVQGVRRKEICERAASGNWGVSGESAVAEVQGLTGSNRERAIYCLTNTQSFLISEAQVVQLLSGLGNKRSQRQITCTLTDFLPYPLSASSVSAILGEAEGIDRARSIQCLSVKLPEVSQNVSDLLQILGPLVPEQYPGWEETLYKYSSRPHRDALCSLSSKLKNELSSGDIATLLGQLRNSNRSKGLRCVLKSVSHDLTWDDVDTIVGPSISSIGTMIYHLGERTPDGRNAAIIKNYLDRFENRKFLNDPDPPDWLNGQCVEFAKMVYRKVSSNALNYRFEQASNIISRTRERGLVVETDPDKARVGALIVWDDGGAGHVGVVTSISRDDKTGLAKSILVAESNWNIATSKVTRDWDIPLETARIEFVTDSYGVFSQRSFKVDELDRPPPKAREPNSYRFIGYVLP